MRHSTIAIDGSSVRKTSEPELMAVEVEKTRRAYEISKKCGLFRVPKVLDFDELTGTAIFERLDITPVSKAIPWGGDRRSLAEILGTSLAIIHRDLVLPEEMRFPLPSEFLFSHDEVFLHGDISVKNVCIGNTSPSLVIIDWQMTPIFGGRATYGTRYFDLIWFINNLINIPYTRFIYSNPVLPVIRVFLGSYFKEARLTFDQIKFSLYAENFFKIVTPLKKQAIFEKSIGRARLLWPFSQGILADFLDSLRNGDFEIDNI